MKIAVIGSGIAGLAAGYYLKQSGHHVTILERGSRLGMSAHAVDVSPDSSEIIGDVPSRMFNPRLWPQVSRLYEEIGVESHEIVATQSYQRATDPRCLRLSMPLGFASQMAAGVRSALDANFNQLVAEIQRLRKQGERDLSDGIEPKITFGEYLKLHGFQQDFIDAFLYPALSSTVCTCSHQAIDRYPAVILLDAMRSIAGATPLRRVVAGSREVSRKLAEVVDDVRFDSAVESITEVSEMISGDFKKQVLVRANGHGEKFDHVVVATQANHVADLCPGLTREQRSIFQGFEYEDVRVIVHRDSSLMPKQDRQRSMFNFVATETENQIGDSMCTVWMNQFHRQWPHGVDDVFQTIRPIVEPAAETILQEIRLQRPVVTFDSYCHWDAIAQLHQSPDQRIWFCGSYAVEGIPLLESAVVSGQRIVDTINGTGVHETSR